MRIVAMTYTIVAALAVCTAALAQHNAGQPAVRKPRGKQTAAPSEQPASEGRRLAIVNPRPRRPTER